MGLSKKQFVMIAVLMLGTFLAVLNQTLVAPALPSIMKEMAVGQSTAQWLTTGFTLVNAIMIPVTAFLLDKYTIRRLFLTAMSLFVLGSLLCCLAPGFYLLLLGRLVQATGAGIMQPLVMVVLLKTFPVEKRGAAMGSFGLVIAFAPAIGPTAAGIVIDHLGWRPLFWIIAILTAIELILAFLTISSEKKDNSELHLDILSLISSTLGFGGLLYGLSELGSHGLQPLGISMTSIGIASLIFFFLRQLKLPKPMLEVRVLQNKHFLIACILTMVVQGGLIAGSVLMPIYMQNDLGLSATESGLLMLPSAVVMGLMSPISGKIFDKKGPRMMCIAGMGIMTLGTIALTQISLTTSFLFLIVVYTFRMLGLALVNMPINTWGMNALPNELISHGTSVINTLRQVAGSLGTAAIVSTASIVERSSVSTMPPAEASIHGISCGFILATLLCLIGLGIVLTRVKDTSTQKRQSDNRGQKQSVVEAIMHSEIYCLPDSASVSDAVRLMLEKNVSSLPLLDEKGSVSGLVSDGDILRYLSKHSDMLTDPVSAITYILSTGQENKDFDEQFEELMHMPVSLLASSSVVSVDLHDDIRDICRILGANHVKKVPVMDGDKIVGVIKRSDIFRHALDSYLHKQA